jgi:predicted homoserine dehydrogenase-like protein
MRSRLERPSTPISIAIIGIGSMGKGLLHQSLRTPGIRCVAIADCDVTRATSVAEDFACAHRVVDDLAGLHQAVRDGVLAVCADGDLLGRCESVDAVVESSSSVIAGAGFSVTALQHRKHLILMNSEVDLAFGPYLLQVARDHGATYTSCDGDQHGVIKRLIDEIQLWGFDLMMAGNIKGFLDRYSDPIRIAPEADIRNLDHRMATAYTDGTKLGIEMALLANACNLRVTMPGMQGPRAKDVREVFDLFDFESIRASGRAIVDYILGAEPHGGVFVVGHCGDAYQRSMLKYYKMGDGPFYLFYRPYHLCHIEAMACIADACLDGRSLLQPNYGLQTNVIAHAKRPLSQGERLDGVGGFTCYGLIENRDPDGAGEGLPICLADDLTLERDVPKDGRIALADVRYDAGRLDFALHFRSRAVRACE